MEIKRQITGMMRLLSDKTGRVYQRVGAERDNLTKEPQDVHQTWDHGSSPSPLAPVSNGLDCGQYSTRSKALRILNSTKDLIKVNEANGKESNPCCMCNCKGTLQAILQELRVMRKLMQTQKVSPCQPRLGPGPAPCRRPRKRRPLYKVTPLTVPSSRRAAVSPHEASSLTAFVQNSLVHHNSSSLTYMYLIPFQSEVRLAEDYDIFISKAQLDSILINYTRSGSLLFRKLVCAFFDDATLANSLPNGKRKRGLNDNRKGLDQNIVGAIKGRLQKI
uniref:Si:ch211-220f12.4 n=1 Tax=Sphaeramia orbicularis TaxID=375764 RepID=A0A673AC33_9TELE